MNNRRIDSIGVRCNTCHIHRAPNRAEHRDREVRRAVGDDSHRDEHDHEVDEDGGVC